MRLNLPVLHGAVIALLLAACVGRAGADQGDDIYTRTLRATGLVLMPEGSGTAWVVDLEQGLMITTEHVVANHEHVDVAFPEYGGADRLVPELSHYLKKARRVRAEVIDTDGPRDLALIRLLDRPPDRTTALKLAPQEPRPSARVHSVGNPTASGALWVYSTGTVRQVYRKEWRYADGPSRAARIVEMQSPINAGDSGGPVVNDAGEVVGVVAGRKPEATLMSWCIATTEVRAYLDEVRPLVEPKTAAAYQRRGMRALERGLPVRATEDLSAAYRLNPESADVLVGRAMAYRVRKDHDLALDDIAEALRLNPLHPGAFNVRGCIHADRGENDEALRDFRRAIQIDPRIASIHGNRARSHGSKGEYEQAVRCYDEALRLAPESAEWYYGRGLALEQQGKKQSAEEDYTRAVERDPSYRDRVVLHKVRVVRVDNKTDRKVRVYLRYEGQSTDGALAWAPGTGALSWEFEPGESAVLTHDGRPVLARRIRIWAESADGTLSWQKSKDVDTWTAPAAGYRGGSKPQIFTYDLNR
jgi:tetratricopeptide (TPR) repeat protein